jgi:hypothetical protein
MPILRASLEAAVLRRVKAWWAQVGLDATTVNGTNADLNDPLTTSCRLLGLTLADPLNLAADVGGANVDLAGVTQDQIDQLLDVAEWRCVRTCRANWSNVSMRVGQNAQDLTDLADRLEKADQRLTEQVRNQYGIGLGALGAESIDLGFQQQDDPASLMQLFS